MFSFKRYLLEREFKMKAHQYHDTLNPKFWTDDEPPKLHDDVKEALNKIANEFIEFANIKPDAVKDMVLVGSNVGYTYTDLSDMDLHMRVDTNDPDLCPKCDGDFIKDCFQHLR